MYINPAAGEPRVMDSSGGTRIKLVNQSKPAEPRAATKQKQPKQPAPAVSKAKPARTDPPLQSRKQDQELETRKARDPDLETYEQCKRAFNELAEMHASAQGEAHAALGRLDRAEQELRRAREQATRYAAQIAAQETEMRRVKEGKRAVEELNSKLNARLASAPKPAQDRAGAEERDRLRAAHRDAIAERDRHRHRADSYADIVDHVDKALEICAQACESHTPALARDMRETRATLREFQQGHRE